MRVEIQPTKIGLEAVSSEELKIQNLLQDFPASQSVNFGDRYGFDSGLTQLAQGEEDFFHHLALDK